MEIEGEYRENMAWYEALSYLRSHEFGMLGHDDMEKESFLFLKEDGVLAFYDSAKDAIELIENSDEFADPEVWDPSWYYLPGSEINLTVGGMEFWGSIRSTSTLGKLPPL